MTESLEHCSGKEHSKLFYKLVSWSVNFINYNRYICHKPNIGEPTSDRGTYVGKW